jgi:hypothetical protein
MTTEHGHHHGHHHDHHHRNRGHGADQPSTSEITGWVSGALPPDLYRGAPQIEVDRDEILVVGDVGAPEVPAGLDAEGVAAAERARIARFREETRDRRISVARQAEARYERPISWGATSGATTQHFTTVRARVVTRLGLDHRKVLDGLVSAGLAEHRGEALAWCVDLVQQNEEGWLTRLEEALDNLQQTAADAPGAAT